ncbi:MAG TPA: phospholipase D-like domain-containing protein, partial [Chitinophagaceae bacterium]|nr:phospholipase D-like domain-containing protein [Chitinophagaceae bacterium]
MQCTLFITGNYKRAEEITYFPGGASFFEQVVREISVARYEIFLQLYALENDDTGRMLLKALEEAAGRGVNVFVLLDAFGSASMRKAAKSWIRKGIHIRFFSPLVLGKLRTGRRLHHKLLVIDGKRAYTGSMNFSDKYHGSSQHAPWLDIGFWLSGNICLDIRERCKRLMAYRGEIPDLPPSNGQLGKNYPARLTQNDWFQHKRNIYFNLREAVRFAEKEIIIVSSYFIPSNRLIRQLNQARSRGVEVLLYVQGLSDVPLARNASRYWYRALFRKGVKIFEFPTRVLHGKMLMMDRRWVSAGSFNFNHLSNYTSIES